MFTANGLIVYQLPILEDNFSYLIKQDRSNEALAIDPGDADKVMKLVEEKGMDLKAILITHVHAKHVQGVHEIKAKTGCLVIGPPNAGFEEIDQDVADDEECSIGLFSFQTLSTPGHTKDSQIYLFEDFPLIFSGDTLLLAGAGRIFEGSTQQMYNSLKKIRSLNQKTHIFCGHNSYEKNLLFALGLEPENEEIYKRLEIHRIRSITTTTLQDDLLVNPFLRLDDPKLHHALGFKHKPSDLQVLEELRIRRNQLS